jgi:hypothetical protein
MEIGALLPGDATGVVLHFDDGSSRPIGVKDGVFVVDLPRAAPLPASVSWSSPSSGAARADTGTPPDAASAICA